MPPDGVFFIFPGLGLVLLLLLVLVAAVYDFRRLGRMFLTMVNSDGFWARNTGIPLGRIACAAAAPVQCYAGCGRQAKQQTGPARE